MHTHVWLIHASVRVLCLEDALILLRNLSSVLLGDYTPRTQLSRPHTPEETTHCMHTEQLHFPNLVLENLLSNVLTEPIMSHLHLTAFFLASLNSSSHAHIFTTLPETDITYFLLIKLSPTFKPNSNTIHLMTFLQGN